MANIEKSSTESYPAPAINKLSSTRGDDTGAILDERRRAALAEVDNAEFSWWHVKIVLVAGVGFFTDAYDIFAINIASSMLGYVYGKNNKLSANQDLGIKVATPVGTLVGQLLFGWLADVVGRKRMCEQHSNSVLHHSRVNDVSRWY